MSAHDRNWSLGRTFGGIDQAWIHSDHWAVGDFPRDCQAHRYGSSNVGSTDSARRFESHNLKSGQIVQGAYGVADAVVEERVMEQYIPTRPEQRFKMLEFPHRRPISVFTVNHYKIESPILYDRQRYWRIPRKPPDVSREFAAAP